MDKLNQSFSGTVLPDNSFGNVVFKPSGTGKFARSIELAFEEERWSALPDEPFVAQKKYDILFVSRLIGKLKSLEYQTTSAEYFESLPERRQFAIVEEDFEEDFLQVVSARCKGYVVRPHCKSAGSESYIASLFDKKALYDYEFMLSYNRVVREEGRVILQSGSDHAARREQREKIQRDAAAKKREDERKAQPKRDRLDDRKRKRELADVIKTELQGGREIAIGAVAAVFGGLTANFLRKGAKAADSVTMLIEGMKNAKNQLIKLMGGMWFIPLVIILHYFVKRWDLPFVVGALCSFLPGFLPPGLFDHIRRFFHVGEVETQAGFTSYATLLSTLFTFSVFRGKVTESKVMEFTKRVGSFDRMAKGWDTLITCVMNGLETLINFVRKRFGKESIEIYTRADKVVHEWAKEAEAYLRDEATGVPMDQDRLDGLLKCLQRGYEFKEFYRGTKAGDLINTTVSQLGSATLSHLGAVASRDNSRLEPTTVFLYGAPGVGKTLMSVAFVTALLLESGLIKPPFTADTVKSQIWQKGTSEYWQGYNRQKAIVMDDAFQNRAFAGDKDNDYFNIIKMVGCFSMPLNFADLASKGKIFFGSQLVFGSTNLSSINAEAGIVIQEPEAVARRIKFGYQLFVAGDYIKDGKLDYDKFVEERAKCVEKVRAGASPLYAFPWYIWDVEEHNFITGRNYGPKTPLIDVIKKVSRSIQHDINSHKFAEESLDAMIGAYSNPVVELQGGYRPKVGDLFKASNLRKLVCEAKRSFMDDSSVVSKFLLAASFVTGGFFAYKLIEAFFGGFGKLLSGLFPAREVRLNSNRPTTKPVSKFGKKIITQGGCLSTPEGRVYANTYKMYNETTELIFGQITFLCGNMALQPQHFTESLEAGVASGSASLTDMICFRSAVNASNKYRFTVEDYLKFPRVSFRNLDVEFVDFRLPNLVGPRAHKDVVSSFMMESDLRYVAPRSVMLSIAEVDDGKNQAVMVNTNRCATFAYEHVGRGGLSAERNKNPLFIGGRRMDEYWTYPSARTTGDCGAILSLVDCSSFAGRSVLGIHCAGVSGGVGAYANVVTQEMIIKARVGLQVIIDNAEQDLLDRGVKLIEVQGGSDKPFSVMGSFQPYARVKVPIFICPKTKYYKTALYEPGAYNSYPAILHSIMKDDARVWPMENAVLPYSTEVFVPQIPRLADIVHIALTPFTNLTSKQERVEYTFEQAVLGEPREKFRSIPRNTAAGFPYVYDVTGGKKAFFGTGQEYDLTGAKCAELRERVTHVLTEARKGVRLSHVYVDFLKDELRPATKVEAVATRLISSAPLDYVVAWRMLFGSFSSSIMRHNINIGMAPGICCYSDWPDMVNVLQRMGPKVFDGDFKAFDSSEQPTVHNAILDGINAWYGDSAENQMARRVLWEDLVHSRHIGGRGDSQFYIYQWLKSLPSGHPFTTIVNSLYALICIIACYEHLTHDYRFFWDNVSPLTYGDDNVVNIRDVISGVFNQKSVSAAMKQLFNMTYTSGDKTGELIEFTDIESVTFLKRRFFNDENRWLCPLELDSFLYTHFWCKNKKLEREILISNIENALEELSLHPSSVWDQHSAHLAEVLYKHFNITTRARLTRQSYLSLVLSRVDEWY